MKVELITVGKARSPFVEAGAHYLKMLKPLTPVEVTEVRDDASLIRIIQQTQPDEIYNLVTLEAGGREMTSERWAEWLGQRRQEGRRLTLLIGGPEGLPSEVTSLADQRLSLGPQTMAHQLARIVLLEQLFRASKILAGQKYHL